MVADHQRLLGVFINDIRRPIDARMIRHSARAAHSTAFAGLSALRRLGQNELGQCQVRHHPPQPLVLLLQFFQPGELGSLHPANLANRLCDRRAFSLQNFDLSKLRFNLFGLLSFASHR